jgi:hypothetical protein
VIITDTEQLKQLGSNMQLLLDAYLELLEYATVVEKYLVADRMRNMFDAEVPHRRSWVSARKDLAAQARRQLMSEIGYRGLSERNFK